MQCSLEQNVSILAQVLRSFDLIVRKQPSRSLLSPLLDAMASTWAATSAVAETIIAEEAAGAATWSGLGGDWCSPQSLKRAWLGIFLINRRRTRRWCRHGSWSNNFRTSRTPFKSWKFSQRASIWWPNMLPWAFSPPEWPHRVQGMKVFDSSLTSWLKLLRPQRWIGNGKQRCEAPRFSWIFFLPFFLFVWQVFDGSKCTTQMCLFTKKTLCWESLRNFRQNSSNPKKLQEIRKKPRVSGKGLGGHFSQILWVFVVVFCFLDFSDDFPDVFRSDSMWIVQTRFCADCTFSTEICGRCPTSCLSFILSFFSKAHSYFIFYDLAAGRLRVFTVDLRIALTGMSRKFASQNAMLFYTQKRYCKGSYHSRRNFCAAPMHWTLRSYWCGLSWNVGLQRASDVLCDMCGCISEIIYQHVFAASEGFPQKFAQMNVLLKVAGIIMDQSIGLHLR